LFCFKNIATSYFCTKCFYIKRDVKTIYIRPTRHLQRKNGDQIIIAKIIDSPRGVFKMSAIELVIVNHSALQMQSLGLQHECLSCS